MPRAEIRAAGAEAFRRGQKPDDNPHWPPGTDAHVEWNSGFKGEQYRDAKPVNA
nr:MAG TPA: hypothetical protein [Caudoviricetes sp.]